MVLRVQSNFDFSHTLTEVPWMQIPAAEQNKFRFDSISKLRFMRNQNFKIS